MTRQPRQNLPERRCENCPHWEENGMSQHGIRYGLCLASPGPNLTTGYGSTCDQHGKPNPDLGGSDEAR